ncbi:MAG: hypothetical protein IPK48_00055 [Gammaproteobacteria bacterium]|nr:hypothetical protein [Gammaproteobacteria bacterium]
MQKRVLAGTDAGTGSLRRSPTAPDLERLYRTARDNPEQPPLILIPGVLGSRLEDSRGREVWPGTLWKLLSSRYPELALAHRPGGYCRVAKAA